MLMLNYASLLCIHFTNLDFNDPLNNKLNTYSNQKEILSKVSSKDRESIHKFNKYINSMDKDADMLGAIEIEIAKLAFYDWSQERSEIARPYIEIVNNFIKKSNDAETLLANSLNAATDINYYRSLAWSNNNPIEGWKLDNFLLTADKGLKGLSDIMYYSEDKDGLLKSLKNEAFYNSKYWEECNNILENIMIKRWQALKRGKIINGESLDKFIVKLEFKIRNTMKKVS